MIPLDEMTLIYPEETMNVCTRFHGNTCNCAIVVDISISTKNVNLLVALEEKSEDHQSH